MKHLGQSLLKQCSNTCTVYKLPFRHSLLCARLKAQVTFNPSGNSYAAFETIWGDKNWYIGVQQWFLFHFLTDPTDKVPSSKLITTSSVNQLDNYAVDNIIIRCVDDGPSDDRAENYSTNSHNQAIGRRCRTVTTNMSTSKKCKWIIIMFVLN